MSLDQNPYHDVRSWERRISEPGSVTRIISDGDTDVGVLRLIVGASSVPGTDAQLTTLYCCRKRGDTGLALRLFLLRGRKQRCKLGLLVSACWRATRRASAFMSDGEQNE